MQDVVTAHAHAYVIRLSPPRHERNVKVLRRPDHRRIREELQMVTKIVGRLVVDTQVCLPQGGSYGQIELLRRIMTSADRCGKHLQEALGHLKEANSLTRMLTPINQSSKGPYMLPHIGTAG